MVKRKLIGGRKRKNNGKKRKNNGKIMEIGKRQKEKREN